MSFTLLLAEKHAGGVRTDMAGVLLEGCSLSCSRKSTPEAWVPIWPACSWKDVRSPAHGKARRRRAYRYGRRAPGRMFALLLTEKHAGGVRTDHGGGVRTDMAGVLLEGCSL